MSGSSTSSVRPLVPKQLLDCVCKARFKVSMTPEGSHADTLRRAVLHTSASLTINENASPDVPLDLNVRSASYAASFAQC